MEVGIIEPVEESEWIIPIVIQEKKATGEVRIYIDLIKISDACLHDPFPTPFMDEVLEIIAGKEMFSFTDGFQGYYQVQILQEYRHKTTFVTKWGCYQYTVMPLQFFLE